jgi:hypothetical protein
LIRISRFTRTPLSLKTEGMKNIALALAATLLLAACSTPTQTGSDVANDYALPPKIVLDVQNISFVNLQSPERPASPYDGADFTPSISGAIRKWATDRLQAGGKAGEAIVTVKEAALSREAMHIDTEMDKVFTRQQASKYIGHAVVSIEVRKSDNYAIASAEASRWVSMPEDPDQDERKAAYFGMLNGLMRDLGLNLESSLHDHMGGLILSAPPGPVDPLTVTMAPAVIPAAASGEPAAK